MPIFWVIHVTGQNWIQVQSKEWLTIHQQIFKASHPDWWGQPRFCRFQLAYRCLSNWATRNWVWLSTVNVLGQPGCILYMFQVNQVVLDVLVNQAVDNVSGQPGRGLCFWVNQVEYLYVSGQPGSSCAYERFDNISSRPSPFKNSTFVILTICTCQHFLWNPDS